MRQVKRKTATLVMFCLGAGHALGAVHFGWWWLFAAIPIGMVWARMDFEGKT